MRKKIIFLTNLLFLILFYYNLKAQSTNYFPLAIGNKFVYTYQESGSSPQIQYNIVTKDSIINNKKYYYCSGIFNLWMRVDSIDGNLYSFKNNDTCLSHINEILIDSLRIIMGYARSCYYYDNCQISDTTNIALFENVTLSKKLSFSLIVPIGTGLHHNRIYTQKFGLYSEDYSSSSPWGSYSSSLRLKGCFVDGVSYGDTSISTVRIQNIVTSQITNYQLSQNYPNPFNPSTNIKFQIPKSSFVNLKIYDLMGREVETLILENLNTGEYSVVWDASNFSSGIYFYKLQTENFAETKQMVLLK